MKCDHPKTKNYPIRGTNRAFSQCVTCGHSIVIPPPTDAELDKIYSKDYFKSWGDNPQQVEKIKRETAREILSPLGKTGRLLDCGAAYGAQLEEAKSLGYEPYAIERNDITTTTLKTRFGEDNVFQGNFEDATFPNLPNNGVGGFDVITMFDFIEHVRYPEAVLEKAKKLLKPDGVLIITTPNTDEPLAKILGSRWPFRIEQHLHLFSTKSMAAALEEKGYAPPDIRPLHKLFSLDYLHSQFKVYGPKIGTITTGILKTFVKKPIPIRSGDMVVIARPA